MNAIYHLILIILIGSFSVSAQQWEEKTSNTTEALLDVYFVDASTGFAVGNSGTIIKSIDGGETWTARVSGTNEDLESVSFIDASTGFTVGTNVMLKTVDDGSTWSSVVLPLSVHWMDVEFIDATTGFCVGYSGTILKTSDGGVTWSEKNSDCTRFLAKIQFPTANVGYATSRGYNSNFIKTIDGGETWFNDTIDAALIYGSFESVYFTSENSGIIGSWYLAGLVKTDDGGNSWSDVSGGIAPDLYSIDFADTQTGFAVGINGLIMTTIDGGDSWTSIELTSGMSLNAIEAITPTVAVAVGYNGYIVKNNQATNSLNDPLMDAQVNVYPNPFHDQLTIQLPDGTQSAQVTLTTMTGEIIVEESVISQGQLSALNGLSSGTYLLHIQVGERAVTRLVVK